MPDPVQGAPAAQPSAATQDPKPAGSPAPSAQDQPITRDEFNALMESNKATQRHLNALSAQLRRGDLAPAGNDGDPQAPAPKGKGGDNDVEKLRQEFRDKEARLAEKSKRQGLHDAISASGIEGEDARLLAAFIREEHGGKIALTEDDQVVYRENEYTEAKPLKDFVAGLLKGSLGNRFRPAVRTPNTPRGSSADIVPGEAPSLKDVPEDERAKLDGTASAKKLAAGPFGKMFGMQ